MKRAWVFVGVISSLLLLFAACDMSGPSPEQGAAGGRSGTAAVHFQIGDGGTARTVRPSIALDYVDNWKLTGGKSGIAHTLLAELESSTDPSITIYIEPGTWDFTVEGYKGNDIVLRGSLANQPISETGASLAFTVAPVSDAGGTVRISIQLPDGHGIRLAKVVKNSAELPYVLIPDASGLIVFEADYPAAVYYIVVKLYNKDDELYGVVSETYYVWANLLTEKTYTLAREDLNITYTITYDDWNGKESPTPVEVYYRMTDAAKMLSAPPNTHWTNSGNDYVFKGWYADENLAEGPVTTVPAGSVGDKKFYPDWKLLTVPAEKTLVPALEWINDDPEPNWNYTITVKAGEPNHSAIRPDLLEYPGQNVGITLIGNTPGVTVSLDASSTGTLLTVGKDVTLTLGNNLILQGHSSNDAPLVQVSDGGTLVMESDAQITGNTNSSTAGGGVSVADGGTFTMSGGAISGNIATDGGGVWIVSGSSFTMNNGEISDNTSSGNGGGVAVSGGGNTFTMNNGVISGNNAKSGGGVYVYSGGMFTKAAAGTIYGYYKNTGSTVLEDNALQNTASDGRTFGDAIYVETDKWRTSTAGPGVALASSSSGGAWESEAGVTIKLQPVTGDPVLVRTTLLANQVVEFSVAPSYSSYKWYWDGAVIVDNATGPTYSLHGDASRIGVHELSVHVVTTAGEKLSAHCQVTVSAADSLLDASPQFVFDWLTTNAEAGQTYPITVTEDEIRAPQTLFYDGKSVEIILTGGDSELTISLASNGSLFTLGSGVTLTLGDNITLEGLDNNTASLVTVSTGGALVMESGSKISDNTNSGYGGGVTVNGGSFTMNGGEISGNTSKGNYGGGIYVTNGTFTMKDGVISGNTVAFGGGVYVGTSGRFIMEGGTISGNNATGTSTNGGGVEISGGSFTMSSGIISGNTSKGSNGGGGVELYAGSFTMSGGEISGNEAPSGNGSGGVYARSGTFTMSGGAISGNTAVNIGGGVVVAGATFTMSGGAISGNNAKSGGGVYVAGGAFTMNGGGGALSDNEATTNGGGVYMAGGTFTMNSGTLSGNVASTYGGGVYVAGGTFTKGASGGIIYGLGDALANTAGAVGDGYAAYVASGPWFRDNTAETTVALSSATDTNWE